MSETVKSDIMTHFKNLFAEMPASDVARTQAFEKFLAIGWPHRRMENWRYTPLQKLAQLQYPNFRSSPESLPTFPVSAPQDCVRIIIANGQWQCLDSLPEAIQINSLPNAHMVSGNHPLAMLNHTFYQNGIAITINGEIKVPLYILHAADESYANQALHTRYRIELKQNASVEIIEHFLSHHLVAYHHNVVTEIALADNAKLVHHKLQEESVLAHHTALIDIKQEPHSHYHGSNFSLGGQLARDDVQSELAAHATCHLHGAYLPCGTQHIDHHLDITHADSFSESEMHYKGILTNKAIAVFNGKVLVKPHIHKISAVQKNHNLLLSNDCEVNSKPELEIYSDDIRCNHGATTGYIDPNALFYLRARGLSIEEAKLLIIQAFIQTEIDVIRNQHIHAFIESKVRTRLQEVCYGV